MVNVGWWDLENCGHSPPSVPTTTIILLVTPRLDRCALSDLDVMVVVAHDLREEETRRRLRNFLWVAKTPSGAKLLVFPRLSEGER